MKLRKHPAVKALFAAFPYTLPILAGFLFLGMAYGVYMNVSGFSFIYPMLMSIVIFAGSVEFLVVPMLLKPFDPLHTFLICFIVNARHIFYGLSMLDKYRNCGWKTPYLIFGMCDETFSVNFTAKIRSDIDKSWFFFWVTVLNHLYWFSGATIGGIFGSFINFSTEGLDFVLTAMFVAIFSEQWLSEKDHKSSIVGVIVSLICLIIFGADNYIIPSMIFILFVFAFGRKYFNDSY